MKMKTHIKLYLLLTVAVALSIIISSCEITNPISGLELRLNTMTRESTVTLYLYDAETYQTINEEVIVKFKGESAVYITDIISNPTSELKTDKGFLDFCISDSKEISRENPVTIIVEILSGSYHKVTTSFKVQNEGNISKSVFLLNLSTPKNDTKPENTTLGEADENGTMNKSIKLSTSSGTSLEISAGSVVKDNSGQPLTGELRATLSVIPVNDRNINTYSINQAFSGDLYFAPIYMLSIQILDKLNNSAHIINTTTGMRLILPLEKNANNANSGSGYKEGDEIDILITDEITGELFKIGNGVIEIDNYEISSAGLVIRADINADKIILDNNFLIGNLYRTCDAGISIDQHILFNSFEVFKNGTYIGNATTTEFISESGYVIEGYVENDIISVRLNAVMSDANSGKDIFTGQLYCGINQVAFNIENMSEAEFTLNVLGVCDEINPNDPDAIRKVIYPSATFTYRKIDGDNIYPMMQASLVNGTCVVSGVEPGNYLIHAVYKNHEASATVALNEDGSISRKDLPEGYLYFGEIGSGNSAIVLTPDNNPLIEGSKITLYMLAGDCK